VIQVLVGDQHQVGLDPSIGGYSNWIPRPARGDMSPNGSMNTVAPPALT
jgi:hypothetical protein